MPKEYKFYLKILAIPILSFLLLNLDIDKVSNLRDFMTGFIMAAIIIIMLWLVYSLICSLMEMQKNKKSKDMKE